MKKQIIKKIALYGGAFDPPHIGHEAIFSNLLSLKFVNQIWLLPSGDRTDKKLLFTKDQRFKLLQNLVKKSNLANSIKISDQQINLSKSLKRMIPTIQLLEHFEQKYKQFQFYFVIGADLLQSINTWQQYQRLLSEQKFIIFPRKGYQFGINKNIKNQSKISGENKNFHIPKDYYLSDFYAPQISSSFIKNTLWDQNLSKKQKRQRVQNFLNQLTLKLLQEKQYI